MTTTVSWATGVSGDWNTPSAWSGGSTPNSSTIDVVIAAAGTYTVTISGSESETADSVTLNDPGATLAVAGTLNFPVSSARTLSVTQGTVLLEGGNISNTRTISGDVAGSGEFNGSGTLVNNGTLDADGGTNVSLYVLQAMSNQGTLIANDGFLGVEGSGINNLSGSTLTGGTYISQGFGTADNILAFGFNFDANLAIDAANIVLDGAASEIDGYAGPVTSGSFVAIEQQLQTIASGGTLQLLDTRGYTTTKAIQDGGLVVLQGGTLNTAGLSIVAGGTLNGMGVVGNGSVANQGTIIANGGALDLTNPVTGTGSFTVLSGATLILDGATPTTLNNSGTVYDTSGLLDIQTLTGAGSLVVQNGGTLEFASATAQDVGFSGSNATLRLDDFAGYAGTLVGFSQADTIVLAGTAATKAFVSGSSLVVMNNSSTVDTIQLAGSYAANAAFSVVNQGSNVAVSNTNGAPLQQDFQFDVLLSDTAGLTGTQEGQIVNDLSAAAQDWAQYITGHTTLRIQLDIVSGSGSGAELATGGATTNISNGATLDGRSLLLPSSLIALTTGSYVQGVTSDITVTFFAGNLSELYVNPSPTPQPSGSVPGGKFDLVTVFRHELAHGFGFGGLTSSSGSLGSQETLFDHYIQTVNGTVDFTGPNAEAAYGTLLGTDVATPVPLTTLANGEGYAHFANSNSDPNATDLMSGLGLPAATQRDISPMDLAVLQDVGEPVTAGVVPPAPVPRTLVWLGVSGAGFATAANWNDTTDGLNPATSAPGSIDTAVFSSGAGAVTGSGTVAALSFNANGDWQLASAASLTALNSVSIGVGTSGLVAVTAGASLDSGGTLVVGSGATGIIADTAGGTITAGNMDIAALAGGVGEVSVIGASSALTLSGQLTIGDSASAELSILTGGTVNANNADIGLNAGGTGNVDIEDNGSELNITNNLNIGDAGVGVLTLGNNTTLAVGNNINVGANGILNQLGGSIDPSTITIAPSGRQGGHGSTTASVEISNAGTLYASSGTETVNTPLITAPAGKTGILEIDTNGDLVLNVTSVDATQSVNFTDGTGILTLGTIGGFGGTIATVISGDEIIVQGTSIAADSYNATNDVLTLFNGTAGTIGTLQLAASVNGFALLPNGSGGITVAPCFVVGTRISTERGEVAVEDLREGDRVQVVRIAGATPPPNLGPLRGPRLGGGVAAQPIIWIGHRTVDCTRHPEPRKVWPVCIAAGAFGPNRPYRELFLSPDHAVAIGGVLIPVKHLINGTSIVQVQRHEVTYYHVELPRHSLLLAEGLLAESYLDTGDRSKFCNSGGPIALYPDFHSRVWEAEGCAPLVVTGSMLDAAKRWVNSIAAEARWAA
jgi:collagen type I alpha